MLSGSVRDRHLERLPSRGSQISQEEWNRLSIDLEVCQVSTTTFRAVEPSSDCSDHSRFLIINDRNWTDIGPVRSKPFPNLRATIERVSRSASPESPVPYPRHDPRFIAQLKIYADINFSTLSSILDYPFNWHESWRAPVRNRILGITDVAIENDAILYPSDVPDRTLFMPTECGPDFICIEEPCHMDKEPERTETCVRALAQLAMQGERPRRQLFIQCNWAAQAASWSRQVALHLHRRTRDTHS